MRLGFQNNKLRNRIKTACNVVASRPLTAISYRHKFQRGASLCHKFLALAVKQFRSTNRGPRDLAQDGAARGEDRPRSIRLVALPAFSTAELLGTVARLFVERSRQVLVGIAEMSYADLTLRGS